MCASPRLYRLDIYHVVTLFSQSIMACTALTSCDVMPATFTTSSQNGASTPFVEVGYASTGFLIMCSAIVMIMTPAVGMLYSGLARTEHALSVMLLCCLAYAIVSIQWVIFGFSLSFSESSYSPFIGNLAYVGLEGLTWQALPLSAPAVSGIVYALYQLQFATVTVAIIFGSVIERIHILPSILFMFVWTTCIYDPIAYWTWGAHGWVRNMSCLSSIGEGKTPCQIGGLDFAGGGPVHMASGTAALAFCIFLGRRKHVEETDAEPKPHSVMNVFLATVLLWMGWFGFNGGSALAATPRAGYAAMVTTIAASAGGVTWSLIDCIKTKRFSGIAFCSGAVAGLVGITPASGYVNAWSAILIGIITAAGVVLALPIKGHFGYDDATDAWGLHGVGGFIGNICTGLFASKAIPTLDGTVIPGGLFFDGTGYLLGYNLAAAAATVAYSFVGTLIIIFLIDKIPGLSFRLDEEHERKGTDIAIMGETAECSMAHLHRAVLSQSSLVPINEESPRKKTQTAWMGESDQHCHCHCQGHTHATDGNKRDIKTPGGKTVIKVKSNPFNELDEVTVS